MRLSEKSVMIIFVMCGLEQFFSLAVTIWLIGWKGWSASWIFFTFFMMLASSPSLVINAIQKSWGKHLSDKEAS